MRHSQIHQFQKILWGTIYQLFKIICYVRPHQLSEKKRKENEEAQVRIWSSYPMFFNIHGENSVI
jgi:hypothetical protein